MSVELKKIRVGVVEKNQHPFWESENAGWATAAERLGLEVAVTAPEREDLATQRALMEEHLDTGVDALAFVGTYPDAFDDIVARAVAQNVVVICFDLDAPLSGRTLFVGMEDPFTMGRWAADTLASLLDSVPKKIGVLTGSDRAAGAVGKLSGFKARMNELGHAIVGGANDGEDAELCRVNCLRLLEAHPDIDALYGVYAYHTTVMAQVAADLSLDPRPKIFGWDVLPETIEHLRSGRVDQVAWIKEYYYGYYGAGAVANLVRLGQPEALAMMSLDPLDLPSNRICPTIDVITPATVENHVRWRRDHGLGD
ncbi:MAG: substrate-binding domain-containing protein [Bifidobacteriaceae bacterium]|jgi:ribose transport system substrate-binding protein|nr:substrate-binding domain-containing protein [Bifidobacteriaceae bacterium]